MNINEQMNKILETAYPTARPGFIRVLVDALDLHSKKNAVHRRALKVDTSTMIVGRRGGMLSSTAGLRPLPRSGFYSA